MTNFSHLIALQDRLAHEVDYLAREKTEAGRQLRQVWIAQIEKEIAFEKKFLGLEEPAVDMTDEELMAELGL